MLNLNMAFSDNHCCTWNGENKHVKSFIRSGSPGDLAIFNLASTALSTL